MQIGQTANDVPVVMRVGGGLLVFPDPATSDEAAFHLDKKISFVDTAVACVLVFNEPTLGDAQCSGIPVCKYSVWKSRENEIQRDRLSIFQISMDG